MAYEVTATRRRPRLFEDLAGQEFVAQTLQNAINSKSIAHAYLFSGPRGCGKTSTARILAKALNCQCASEPTCSPCGECESCKAITNSSSLDVIEIDGASNTSVNDVRQIKDEVMYPPSSISRYKIYIIDEVHMLSTSAFNALLKTIEEPPAYAVFIFATTELQKVPATIKSRCQQYNFRLVSVEKIKNLLADACQELDIQADEEALYWIAKESGGSVRDSYTLFDQVAAASDGFITYEKIRDKFGILGVERLNEIFSFCATGDAESAIQKLDEFLQSGISFEQLISNSCEYLRSLLLIKNGIKKESLLGQSAERYAEDVLSLWNTVQIERALSIFLQVYRDIRYSISVRYELELAFSRLCALKEYVSPGEVKVAIEKARALLMGEADASKQTQCAQPTSQVIYQSTSHPTEQSTEQTTEQRSNVVPPLGMPTFSALAKSSADSSNSALESASDKNTDRQENQAPFYDGGALPPKTTAAISVPTEINSSNLKTATDIEDYSGEAPLSSEKIHESSVTFTAPDGFSIQFGNLFGKVIAELSVSNAMLSSVLMQTGTWNLDGNKISTTIKTEYQKTFIENSMQQITDIISKNCHSQMQFEVQLETQQKRTTVELPPQVKMICNVFKGYVPGVQS